MAADFFKREFGIEAQTKVLGSHENEKFFEHIDPNWVSAILTIPSAILASIELNKRYQLIEHTNAMLEEVRKLLGTAGGVIRIGAAKTFDIASAKAKDIVDALRSEDDGEA